ncbi:MAG: HEAT repeat domain-containing protein [Armatimonadetes bacterium]|nr:HEAT repeat domain-containing protein [Armatimonadota bacterium]
MTRGLIIGAVVVVAFFAAFYAAARKMQSLSDWQYYDPYAVSTTVTSAEWVELYEYESQGSTGWAGLERLMASHDSGVAAYASELLCDQTTGSYEHFFRGMPSIQTSTKSSIGMGHYPMPLWYEALSIFNDEDSELREGAAYFIRIARSRSPYEIGAWSENEFGDALVGSIPSAEGAYAEHLAMTISMYPPEDDEALLALLDSDDAAVRKIVVQTLGKIALESYLEPLSNLANDPDSGVRQAVVTAKSTILKTVIPGTGLRRPVNSTESSKKRLGMP